MAMARLPLQTRVAYDSQVFSLQSHGGISRYFSELIKNFREAPELGVEPVLTFTRSNNQHLATTGSRVMSPRMVPNWTDRLRRYPVLNDQLEQYVTGHHAQQSDILHATYYRPLTRDLRSSSKLAITVVDLIPEILGLRGADNPHLGKAALIERADLILTISEATTAQLRHFYPTLQCPIITTPLAVAPSVFSPEQRGSAPAITPPAFPYVLFVGRRGGYKNFAVLASALRTLVSRGSDLGLVIAGAPLSSDELALLDYLPVSRLLVSRADDRILANLYRNARAFVFPSRLEGFGLPLLEAMESGCPVVASDIQVFREVAGDAAEFFDPSDADALASAIERVQGSTRRAQLVAAGTRNAQRFSWEATAEGTAAAYRLVTQHGA